MLCQDMAFNFGHSYEELSPSPGMVPAMMSTVDEEEGM